MLQRPLSWGLQDSFTGFVHVHVCVSAHYYERLKDVVGSITARLHIPSCYFQASITHRDITVSECIVRLLCLLQYLHSAGHIIALA